MSGDNADLTLVLAYRWTKDLFDLSSRQPLGMATEPDALPHLLDALEKISEEISQGKRIIIIGNVPAAHVAGEFMREGYERCRSFLNSDCPASYPIDLGEAKQFNAALAEFAAEHDNVVFVDPRDALCDKETCFVVSDGDLLYSDHSHLTTRGARMVVDRLTETAAMDLTETGS